MTDWLRPQARATLWRWRDVIAGGVICMAGLWWAASSFGLIFWVAAAVTMAGAVLVVTGVQRMRFARGGGGAGVVEVRERRIAYLGPLTGGVVDLDDLTRLELDPANGLGQWRLYTGPSATLVIPVDAEGADGLFDAFAALPGLQVERMLDALNNRPKERVMVWRNAHDVQPRLT